MSVGVLEVRWGEEIWERESVLYCAHLLCTGSGMTPTLCGVMCGHISMTSSIHSSQNVRESSSPKLTFLN